MRKISKKKQTSSSSNLYYLLPLLFVVAVVPLVVYMKEVTLDERVIPFWIGGEQNIDFFSYYKSRLIIASGLLSLVALGVGVYLQKVRVKKLYFYYGPFLLLALLILFSALLSEYRGVAVWGFADRYEGMLVLLSYLAITFAAVNLVNEEKDIKYFMGALFASALVVGVIGMFQYFGLDFFRSPAGRLLILPSRYYHLADQLSFTFGPRTIYATMYNTNYVGSYAAMLFSLSLVFFLYLKNYYHRVALGAFTVLMFAVLLGCNSRAGYVGAFFSGLVILVLFWKPLAREWKSTAPLAACFLVVLVGMNYAGGGRIFTAFGSLLGYMAAPLVEEAPGEPGERELEGITDAGEEALPAGAGAPDGVPGPGEYPGDDPGQAPASREVEGFTLQLEDKRVHLDDGREGLQMLMVGDQIMFRDDGGQDIVLEILEEGSVFALQDPRFEGYLVQLEGENIRLSREEKSLLFSFSQGVFRLLSGEGDGEEITGPALAAGETPPLRETTPPLTNFEIREDLLTLTAGAEELKVLLKDDQLTFSDKGGEEVSLEVLEPGTLFALEDPRYEDYRFLLSGNILQVQKGRRELNFGLVEGQFKFVNHRGEMVDLEPVDTWGFQGRERMGSSRGYIWSRSIPLLRDTLLLGYGPDTYAIYYPQHDYVGKSLFLGGANRIVDKPHNLYLQVGINTGVLSLLAFLFLVSYYCIHSVPLYLKSGYNDLYSIAGGAVLAALVGYLVAGIFNDSIVSVAPVFWALLGLGICCNHQVHGDGTQVRDGS